MESDLTLSAFACKFSSPGWNRVALDVRLPGGNQSCEDFGDGHFDDGDDHDVVDDGDGDDVKDFCN